MNININDQVRVELTEFGLTQLRMQYSVHTMPKLDGMFYECPLWELFADFGECIHMGMKGMPFVDNKIEVKET